MKNFLLSVALLGVCGLVLVANDVSAATFESMKEHVEKGNGVIFNPVSEAVMTKESSLEFVQIIEEEKNIEKSEEVTTKMMNYAYEETKSATVLPKEEIIKDSLESLVQSRGASRPTNVNYIEWLPSLPHASNPFSASGWRYSDVNYTFYNADANPYFGVRATLDSFYFHTPRGQYVVPANGSFMYVPSKTINGGKMAGYFSTYNPVKGSRYYIY